MSKHFCANFPEVDLPHSVSDVLLCFSLCSCVRHCLSYPLFHPQLPFKFPEAEASVCLGCCKPSSFVSKQTSGCVYVCVCVCARVRERVK